MMKNILSFAVIPGFSMVSSCAKLILRWAGLVHSLDGLDKRFSFIACPPLRKPSSASIWSRYPGPWYCIWFTIIKTPISAPTFYLIHSQLHCIPASPSVHNMNKLCNNQPAERAGSTEIWSQKVFICSPFILFLGIISTLYPSPLSLFVRSRNILMLL